MWVFNIDHQYILLSCKKENIVYLAPTNLKFERKFVTIYTFHSLFP